MTGIRYRKSLFIFRRDLRLDDNSALMKACDKSTLVIPCFIFDPKQMKEDEYFSKNAFQFMMKSLKELIENLERRDGRLYLFQGDTLDIVRKLLFEENVDAVFFNSCYTSFYRMIDNKIADICDKNNIDCFQIHDYLINPPELVLKEDGKPYTVFTYFHNKSEAIHVKNPVLFWYRNLYNKTVPLSNQKIFDDMEYKLNASIHVKGGRKEAVELFDKLRTLRSYEKERDFPSLNSTSNLSAHCSFGIISIREAYRAGKESVFVRSSFLRQLYWRDFFNYICYFYPHVFTEAFHSKFNSLEWENNETWFEAWKTGTTGFPLIDAGMRQLNKTGYMNNRVRMIAASFLVKDLHIDWRLGEKYFAQNLVDYDQCSNNGNWQWSASTGCDAQPYFRIFNPWLQQRRYDPDCVYIRNWIPELVNIDNQTIHSLHESNFKPPAGYPSPIVDHDFESVRSKEKFAFASERSEDSKRLMRGKR